MVDDVLSCHDDGDTPIKPANVKRQRKLFKDSKPKPRDEYHEQIRGTTIAAVRSRYNDLLAKDKVKARSARDVRRSGKRD